MCYRAIAVPGRDAELHAYPEAEGKVHTATEAHGTFHAIAGSHPEPPHHRHTPNTTQYTQHTGTHPTYQVASTGKPFYYYDARFILVILNVTTGWLRFRTWPEERTRGAEQHGKRAAERAREREREKVEIARTVSRYGYRRRLHTAFARLRQTLGPTGARAGRCILNPCYSSFVAREYWDI